MKDLKEQKHTMNNYISGNKNLRCQRQNDFAADPWKTWIWTTWIHIFKVFFNSKHHSTIWVTVGWVCWCGNTDTEEPCIWRTNLSFTWIFECMEGQSPLKPQITIRPVVLYFQITTIYYSVTNYNECAIHYIPRTCSF